jgi:hypothetical protein
MHTVTFIGQYKISSEILKKPRKNVSSLQQIGVGKNVPKSPFMPLFSIITFSTGLKTIVLLRNITIIICPAERERKINLFPWAYELTFVNSFTILTK